MVLLNEIFDSLYSFKVACAKAAGLSIGPKDNVAYRHDAADQDHREERKSWAILPKVLTCTFEMIIVHH